MPIATTSSAAGEALSLDAIADVAANDAERYLLALASINLSVSDWNLETGVVDHPPPGQAIRGDGTHAPPYAGIARQHA
jgi:hypothetical protein